MVQGLQSPSPSELSTDLSRPARSYYGAPISEFLRSDSESIFGILAANCGFALEDTQRLAWRFQIDHLSKVLVGRSGGHLFMEFQIPRIGRRADVILVLRDTVFVLEYKVGSSTYDRNSIEQVTDYALDLKNFHSGSHRIPIIPILIATEAADVSTVLSFGKDKIAEPLLGNARTLGHILAAVCGEPSGVLLDAMAWEKSPYSPTPSIIEAAQALYRNHTVSDISRFDAGASNLTRTSACVTALISRAEAQREKIICFLTGVPGGRQNAGWAEHHHGRSQASGRAYAGSFSIGQWAVGDRFEGSARSR